MTYIIIPCRLNSTRFPGKVLHPLKRHPMYEWVYRAARCSKLVDGVAVATSDMKVRMNAQKKNIPCIFTGEHLTGTDRVAEAAKKFKPAEHEVIINLQADEPAITVQAINQLIQMFDNPDVNVATLVRRVPVHKAGDRDMGKVMVDRKNRILDIKRIMPLDGEKKYYAQVGIYGFRYPYLKKYASLKRSLNELERDLEQYRLLDNDIDIYCAETVCPGFGIDREYQVKEILPILPDELPKLS